MNVNIKIPPEQILEFAEEVTKLGYSRNFGEKELLAALDFIRVYQFSEGIKQEMITIEQVEKYLNESSESILKMLKEDRV
jgi:hypothetical protein